LSLELVFIDIPAKIVNFGSLRADVAHNMVLQFIVNGLITGILYSLVAIGFALVYNTTKLFHIAAAAIYVFPAFVFYWLTNAVGLQALVSSIIAIALTMGLSLGTDLCVYRPLERRKASGNVIMIASIGVMTIIINVLSILLGNDTKVITTEPQKLFSLGGILITTPQMWQLVLGGTILVVFLVILGRSSWGLQLRAISSVSSLYETLGYDSARTRSWLFLLSGAFLGVCSCLTVYDVGMDLNMGMSILINAMVAMIVGGIGRFGTCVIGGVSLGILQSVTVYYFSASWQNAVSFVLLMILLFLRPQGIAGYKQRIV